MTLKLVRMFEVSNVTVSNVFVNHETNFSERSDLLVS